MVLLIVSLFTGSILFSIGFLLNARNAPSMISGYNNLSEEEQKQVRLNEYVSFFRKFHFTIGSLIVIFSLLFYFLNLPDLIGLTLLIPSLAGYTFFIYKSQYYYPPQKRKTFMIAFYVMLLVSIGVIILFILPYQETEVEIFDHQMIISGIYSETLSIDQIDKAEFLQYYPPVKLKTNGFALTNLKKGWFKLESGEKVKLFINDMSGPFLKIYTNQNYSVIIGLKNVDEELLYRQIKLLKK